MTRLVSLRSPRHGDGAAVCVDDELLLLAPASAWLDPGRPPLPRSLRGLLAAGEQGLPRAKALAATVRNADEALRLHLRQAGVLLAAAGAPLLAPLPRPTLLLCCGNTYAGHVSEMGGRRPQHPGGFLKSPHTVIGPGEPIVLPRRHPAMVDFEGEFAFVIGRSCHDVDADGAIDCIAGYTLVNDVSARDWVDEARASGDMFFNTLGKQFPTFCPMGPALVTCDEVPDPAAVRLATALNGETMQQATLAELVFPMAELLAFWSRWYRFAPGDVVTTGSPPGVGFARTPPRLLRPGDEVCVAADGIGSLGSPVVAATADAAS